MEVGVSFSCYAQTKDKSRKGQGEHFHCTGMQLLLLAEIMIGLTALCKMQPWIHHIYIAGEAQPMPTYVMEQFV